MGGSFSFWPTIPTVPDASIYFAYSGGRKRGPLDGTELEALARDGELGPDDLVWKSGTPEWLKASVYVEFGAPFPEAEEAPLLEVSGIRPHPPSPPPPPPPVPAPAVAEAGPAEVPAPAGKPAPAPGSLARQLADDLRALPAGEIFPLRRLLDPEALGAPAAILLLVFGLGPLGVVTVVEDPVLRARLFNFSLAALWATFLLLAFPPRRPSPRLGTALFLSSVLLGALFSSLLPGVLPVSWLHALGEPSRAFPVRFLAVFPGAFLTEAAKAGLLVLLARRLGGASDPAGGLAHGLVAGLGFGLWEASSSSAWGGAGNALALTFSAGSISAALYAFVVSSVVTTAAIPLLHAAWTGLAGYALGVATGEGRRPGAFLLAGVAAATLLHTLYDTFLSGGSTFLAFLAAAAALLFLVACRRGAELPSGGGS